VVKPFLASLALLIAALHGLQAEGQGAAIVQKMMAIVLAHNPVLTSAERLAKESDGIPRQDLAFLIPGVSVGAGFGAWNPQTNTYVFVPNLTLGLTFSFSDPTRTMNIFRIQEAKEKAKQDWEISRVTALSLLFSKIREIVKLQSQVKSHSALKKYLEDFSSVAETQSFAQTMGPEKLWDLKERLATLQADLQAADGQIQSLMLETAMSLGGDAWEELLALLRQLAEQGL
jgi:hypothetical protein